MKQRSIVSIGNFDGVHAGHRAILAHAAALAQAHQACVTAFTFHPHPATVLRPGAAPPCLTDLEARIDRLREAGAEHVVVLEATAALLHQSPAQFIERVVAEHAPLAFVEGRDFRFGHRRAGDVALLGELGRDMDFTVHIVDPVEVTLPDHLLVPASSSVVRWLLRCGRVADAAAVLGRAYSLTGKVVRGQQRGRTIGIPTLNLNPPDDMAIPADGVYAGVVDLPDASAHPAAISVGCKPTFDGQARVIEAHLLDYDGDLYDRTVTVHFRRWVRDQQRFPSFDALTAQLRRDLDTTRKLLKLQALSPTGSRHP